jgi:hypothetical protein
VIAWTNDDVAAVWAQIESLLPEDLNSVGVTYHGPDDDRPWVAWASTDGLGTAFGHEGWGDTPMNALRALVAAYDHDAGWWSIKGDDELGRGPG